MKISEAPPDITDDNTLSQTMIEMGALRGIGLLESHTRTKVVEPQEAESKSQFSQIFTRKTYPSLSKSSDLFRNSKTKVNGPASPGLLKTKPQAV